MPRSGPPLLVRLPLHGARRALRTTRAAADLGLIALDLVGRALGDEPSAEPPWRAAEPPPSLSPFGGAEPAANGRAPRVMAVPDVSDVPDVPDVPIAGDEAVAAAEAVTEEDVAQTLGFDHGHVEEEPELVDEVSDPGAEDGAGAAIRVDPPFAGYESLRAADVIAQLPGADAATLGAIELYEQTHRRRRTVLDALAREARRRG